MSKIKIIDYFPIICFVVTFYIEELYTYLYKDLFLPLLPLVLLASCRSIFQIDRKPFSNLRTLAHERCHAASWFVVWKLNMFVVAPFSGSFW